ncbi:LPXTG cell wall anchor domain-containing protein [Enterococcus quebecensis]|uniref:Gram-positive cocci surface proteins LPxTG domain-containing protein n=1 Tax=Enterococcus quebecensis TaxID=903983 RepID=A0A1E5H301_9ENTE|nr:LPXTG cell wall anchor domain-containing protein [Enterococcus quebecensis]OEG19273.1 hypothetical protein BCR23_00870 [Enterococcus quebecensis]
MKKKKLILSTIAVSILGLTLFLKPVRHFAVDGGQVGHEAVIEFYSDDQPEKESVDEPKDSVKPTSTKPVGRYPQTGEIIKKSLTLSGAIVVLLAIVAYMKKRKKEQKGENKL